MRGWWSWERGHRWGRGDGMGAGVRARASPSAPGAKEQGSAAFPSGKEL